MKKGEMKKWAKAELRGVENALVPSFTPDLKKLDEAGIRLDVQQSIKHGFFSTMCAAEVGLTLEEAKQFLTIVVDEAKDKIHVSTALLMNTKEENIELAVHAGKVGCKTALMGYPFNWRPESSDEIVRYTQELCDAADIGIVLYPSPSFNF
jgi:4-hydroxy-tetrahydrodipicolinate synthase